ncbi:MAG: PAS domain S-box protein, partial [Calditrichaeota bacterium]|nr:PAS domain S-box protein [Calditrichota bacterium]
ALTFFWLSNAISLRCFPHGFASLLWGKLAGSQLLRSLVPVVVIFPLVLSYLLIELIAKRLIQYDFGIVFYTVTFILIGLYYVTLLAHYLNKNDQRRLELEQDLRSNNEKLSVFKQSMDATNIVSTTDTEGTLLEVNDNFCQISGYSRGELIGENYRILNSGYHPQSFFEGLWSTLKAGEVWVGEVCNKRKDGTLFWVYTTIVPLKNKAGEIEAFLSVRRDITRVKEDQALLASTYVKNLEQQNREMEQFVYIASHDLNEPLRTVKMMTDMILTDKPESWNAATEQKFGFIREAVVRMLSLTQGLLDYSRLGRARHRESADCNVLVEHVRQDLAGLLRDGGGNLEWEELPVIDGYPVELRLLFQNLIHNALKFARKDLPARVKISVAFEHGYWRFAVQDNGIGFPPEFRSRIFIIFQRLNPRAEYPGSGIGLAFCQKIVHLHGGEIWADSREGEGSTFYFTLAPKILKPTSLPK